MAEKIWVVDEEGVALRALEPSTRPCGQDRDHLNS